MESDQPLPAGVETGGVTDLLLACRGGNRDAFDRVFPIIYEELHRVAHAQLRREREGHTLSTTALVHEAYIRLVDVTRIEWRDRVHFVSMAARAMRRILIDNAREHQAARRGGGMQLLPLEEVIAVDRDAVTLLELDRQADTLVAVDRALQQLAELNERLVRVVECRFFGGLTEEETAQALGINQRTVRRDWVKARGWLKLALAGATD
jgi:RNA polymerase sigma factor (TIGR02999 family)